MNRSLRLIALVCAAWPAALVAQQAPRTLSLEEALRLAESQSEVMRIAQAGVTRARGQQMQARSAYLPQVGATMTYARTLASPFSALSSGGSSEPPPGTPPVPPDDGSTYYSPCTRYLAPAGATDAERVVALETYARCASSGGALGGIDFSKVGFGSKNQYQIALQGSLDLFTAGRAQSQNRSADAGRRVADIELASQRAQLALTVTSAYFDAVLADRLVAIAESSLVQTEGVLKQTSLAREVGNQSEFELLRAQVTRDNQMPMVLQRRTDRDLAYLRLKQLLNLPYQQPVSLSTQLADEKQLLAVTQAAGVPAASSAADADTSTVDRAPVRQLVESLRSSESQLHIARSQWVPSLTLSTQYARVAYPNSGVPSWSNFLTNWTVSLSASVPLFTGGRIRGGAMVAEANLRETQARLDQTKELASLDAQQAIAQLSQAQAALAASMGTAGQAQRAYNIAEVRYREGLSTQIELNDSRLLLQQAGANQAQAVRDLQVARMRLALLKDLPLGSGGSSAASAASMGGSAGSLAPNAIAPQGGAAAASSASQVRTSTSGGPGGA